MNNTSPRQSLSSWSDWLWVNGLTLVVILLIFFGGGCGTGIGNPGEEELGVNLTTPSAGDFLSPVDEYNLSSADIDCGRFDETSTLAEVNTGRACVRSAFEACDEAKYLLDEETVEGHQFTSFVEVMECELRIHTVSSDPARWVGNETAMCSELGDYEAIELACGLGD